MATIQVIEDLLALRVLNMKNRELVVNNLLDLLVQDDDLEQIVTYLLKFHYLVCQSFFEAIALFNSDDKIINVTEALINNELFLKGISTNYLYPKGFAAVMALASKEKYQPAFLVLNCILSDSEKSGAFSESCLNQYKKLVFDKDGHRYFSALLSCVKDGTVICKEFEKERLISFFQAVDEMIISISNITKSLDGIVSAENSQEQNQRHRIKQSSNQSENEAATEMLLLSQFAQKQEEIFAMLHRLAQNHSIIESLSASLSHRGAEMSIISAELIEKSQRIVMLESEIARRDKQLNDAEINIVDLTERLRSSLQMDDISKRQEMITLKNEISEALKLDYEDFVRSKENPYSQDLFEAYRSTLKRIFKLLKRFEITCQ